MKVAIIMGSDSDWDVMRAAAETLKEFSVDFDHKVVSAHRTPPRHDGNLLKMHVITAIR